MEKVKISTGPKVNSINKKEKIGSKIDSLWTESPLYKHKEQFESNKLKIKLETKGKERSKIFLKIENNRPKVQFNNYHLISELLKEFFNIKQNFK